MNLFKKLFKKKSDFRFNWNLAQRFVNDYRLPIPIMSEKMFEYHLNLYEKEFGCLTNWNKLWSLIDYRFEGNPEKFLTEFYSVREKIVTEVPQNEAFQKFNTCDMNVYATPNLHPRCSSLYNENNIGNFFVSIDLTKGNFQALNYVDKEMLNADTYINFIRRFTDIYYIEESKYFRQVIFGQMNPKRHIVVEKYMMNKVYELLKEKHHFTDLVVSNSDELIYEVDCPMIDIPNSTQIEKEIFDELGITVHVNFFELHGWNLYSAREKHKRCTFYVKNDMEYKNSEELMCVPQPYFSIVYKLYHNLPLAKEDFHFNYENIDCIFNDNFYIENIKPKY